MLWHIKQVFIALLSFGESLATKCVSLNNEPCIIRPTLIELNTVERNCYPFMISLDKCNGSCNVVDDVSTKIFVPSETKDVNLKVFNMITKMNEAKTLVTYVLCNCKRKFDTTTCNWNKKWNNKYPSEYKKQKKHRLCKKDYSWILAKVFVRLIVI